LVAFRPTNPVFRHGQKILATLGQLDSRVPNRQILEALVSHGLGISDFKFEI
jgi:hypothetical protein